MILVIDTNILLAGLIKNSTVRKIIVESGWEFHSLRIGEKTNFYFFLNNLYPINPNKTTIMIATISTSWQTFACTARTRLLNC